MRFPSTPSRAMAQALAPDLSLAGQLLLVVVASLVIAASAQVRIELGFSPVPITGQTLGVLLVGALLGPRLAFGATTLYIVQGVAGLPVFAGGTAGVARLLGPTGGYLIGFVLAASFVGWLAERGWDRRPVLTLLAMTLGNVVIYAFGLAVLSLYVPAERLLIAGLLPFIPGDLVKIVLAAALLPAGWRVVASFRGPAAP
ncbi:MAG: biotin transporter BioY [Chloroflexi bacterium]|nr:biotin transporter BioY [Chloroflexota bacterium]